MTTIRFFTTLMLRPGEEVDASIVPWLDRWATVEFDGDRPVTGVWLNKAGARRVCWYGPATDAEWRDAHRERHGEEPCWLLRREVDAEGELGAMVEECDDQLDLVARYVWTFDIVGMPATAQVFDRAGNLVLSQRYIRSDRVADFVRERRSPSDHETESRLYEIPVPELSAEPFPCGGTIVGAEVRVIGPIAENWLQGRYLSICRWDGAWRPAIATLAFVGDGRLAPRSILSFAGEFVAPLVGEGDVHHPRWPGWDMPLRGVAELLPGGSTVEEIVESAPVDAPDAVRIVSIVGDVARRALESGNDLGGGIRPELIYLRRGATGFELSGMLHRGAAVLAATRRGEAILFPPNSFPCDFSHRDDVTGLAQLLWYMVTGGHPFLAQEDIRWNASWDSFRHQNRRRQPWRGPSGLQPLLERTLFHDGEPPTLAEFLAELRRVHER